MTENTTIVPAIYADNILLARLSAIIGKPLQKIKAELPYEELSGDYLANLVAGLTPEEREFFAASFDAQIFAHNMRNVAAITEPREGGAPHWIAALCTVIYRRDDVSVDVDVIMCGC